MLTYKQILKEGPITPSMSQKMTEHPLRIKYMHFCFYSSLGENKDPHLGINTELIINVVRFRYEMRTWHMRTWHGFCVLYIDLKYFISKHVFVYFLQMSISTYVLHSFLFDFNFQRAPHTVCTSVCVHVILPSNKRILKVPPKTSIKTYWSIVCD